MENHLMSEIKVTFGSSKQGKAFGTILTNHIEENKIENRTVFLNRLGTDLEGNYFFNLLGTGLNILEFEDAVKKFLNGLMTDLKSEEYQDDIMMLLEDEEWPEVGGYEILNTRFQ